MAKLGMLFPGYGSQWVGMGKELYDESRTIQEYFEEAANCLNGNFVKLCFAASHQELSRLENADLALFVIGCSVAAHLSSLGIVPTHLLGYNNGLLSALHTAGALSFPDGLYFLTKQQNLYQELLNENPCTGLRITGLTSAQLQSLCKQVSHDQLATKIACYEAPTTHIVIGKDGGIDSLKELLSNTAQNEENQVAYAEITAEFGLHSDAMAPVVTALQPYLTKITCKDTRYPVYDTTTQKQPAVIQSSGDVENVLLHTLTQPIYWHQAITQCAKDVDVLVAICPGDTLVAMVKAIAPEKPCFPLNTPADILAFKRYLADTDLSYFSDTPEHKNESE